MDETAKVIIATISGFVIASFAEPVKIYFQNATKLQLLRLGLHKELCENYGWFLTVLEPPDDPNESPKRTLKNMIDVLEVSTSQT